MKVQFLIALFIIVCLVSIIYTQNITNTQIKEHQSDVYSTAVSNDGSRYVSGAMRELFYWEAGRKEPVDVAHSPIIQTPSALRFSDDGKILAVDVESTIELQFSAENRQVQLVGHRQSIESVVFSPDNRFLLSFGSNIYSREVMIWDVQAQNLVANLTRKKEYGYPKFSVFLPDEKKLVIVYQMNPYEFRRRIFSMETWREERVKNAEMGGLANKITPDGKTLIVSQQGKVWAVDAASGNALYALPGKFGILPYTNVQITPDGKTLAILFYNADAPDLSKAPFNRILVWDLVARKQISLIEPSPENAGTSLKGFSLSADGKIIIVGRGRNVVCFDALTGREIEVR